MDELRRAEGDDARRSAHILLKRSLEAPRIKLLTQFNALPDGIKFLVDMRAELLALKTTDPALAALEQELKDLLTTWFDVDFLELRQITWDTASAALLEKLIAYEAVHTINGWDDLKNRLDSDRRCFAYFHPRMPVGVAVYFPSWVEWSMLAGCLSGFIFLYAGFSKLFPLISVWELEEGLTHGADATIARVRNYYPAPTASDSGGP